MKLAELINYLVNSEQLNGLYHELKLDTESEALLIYMKEQLDLESDIFVFGIEETEDNIFFEKGGTKYIQLFPMDYAIDLIKSDLDLKNKGYSNLEIAQRLLEYRKRDA